MRQIGNGEANSGEGPRVYAASRINQLRKSSSAASHLLNDLAHTPSVNNSAAAEAFGANRVGAPRS